MSFNSFQINRSDFTLIIKLSQKHLLYISSWVSDTLFLISVAVSFGMQNLRINSFSVFGFLQEDNIDGFGSDIAVGIFIESLASTFRRQYTQSIICKCWRRLDIGFDDLLKGQLTWKIGGTRMDGDRDWLLQRGPHRKDHL